MTDLAVQQPTPMLLIERAAAAGASIEQMQQLFDLKLRVDADEAKKAFHEAFTAFKAETIRIVRDKENTQYSKAGKPAMYASLESMVATVTPFLSKHGLSHGWDVPSQTPQGITVSCTITHTLGHGKTISIFGPMDTSGTKNSLQQVKSTMTYLKVATFEAVCGLASAYGNLDDDGNGAGTQIAQPQRMADDLLNDHLAYIEVASCMANLQKGYLLALEDAEAVNDKEAIGKLAKAKNARKKKLSEEGA